MDDETLKITLEIIGPERLCYEALKVDYVQVEAEDGEMGLLPGHTSLLDNLRIGMCVSRDGKSERTFAVCSGLLEVREDRVRIFTRAAEEGSDIDKERALRAKERAEKRLASKAGDIDMARARAALSRALNRLRVIESSSRREAVY